MRFAAVLLLLGCAACASVPVTPVDNEVLARADGLVLQGCLDCLLDARALYARLASGHARPDVLQRLFETDLLIALRDRELALPADSALAGAADVARRLPRSLEAGRYLRLVALVPPDKIGSPERDRDAFLRRHQDAVRSLGDDIAWLRLRSAAPGGPFRQYLTVALNCSYPVRGGRFAGGWPAALPSGADSAPPLVAYRLATCVLPRADALRAIRMRSPRFVETSIFLGETELPLVPYNGPGKAAPLLTEAYRVLPESPTVTVLNGRMYQAAGDCETALQYYDATLRLAPLHEEALLGRTACLSALGRADEAIHTATRLIALGTGDQGGARYWRAVNRYRTGDLADARLDADQAKGRLQTSEAYTLAGVIEHDQDSLDTAERDLDRALELNAQDCTAMEYLGRINEKREGRPAAAARFADAMQCYDGAAASAERGAEALRARTDLDPGFQARRLQALAARVVQNRRRASVAAFNAGANYLRAGDLAKAASCADRAAEDPSQAERVAQLRRLIAAAKGKQPNR